MGNKGNNKYEFNIVNTDEKGQSAVIQQDLLAPSIENGNIESTTAYDPKTRNFFVAATSGYKGCTLWQSVISANANSTTPVIQKLKIDYPLSRSPAPLNVAPLVLSRLIVGPDGRLFATFSNGEVHEVDLVKGAFNHLYSLISDELQLGETHPSLTAGSVYDPETATLWSISMAASDAYLISSSLDKKTVGTWLKMAMPQGDNSGFSPETVVDMFMTKVDTGATKVMVMMESLHNLGFDQISFLDTTTGKLDCKECNLMDEYIEFACDTGINACEKWAVAAWDPDAQLLWYQAHSTDMEDYGQLRFTQTGFSPNKATGNLNWWTNVGPELFFGLSGFQWVTASA